MALADLLSKHEKCRERLISAINNDADHSEIQKLDAILAGLITAIENLDLHDPQDIKRQIRFFLSQSEANEEYQTSSVNLRTVDTLITRYADRIDPQIDGLNNDKYISSKLKITLDGQTYSSIEMIKPTQSRVSLFNTEFRYQFTSIGNAKFYNATPSDFVDKHVLDVIGKQRFAQRAKTRLENCFSGIEQRYFHFLPHADKGERLMDCHMAPYYDSDNCVRGAFVAVEDVTEKIENARQHSQTH